MSRYIDREAALQIIDNYAKTVTADGKVAVDAVRDIVDIITPTADVVEVRHGEWIDTDDKELDSIYSGYKCSVCGFIICGHSGKYCSECGAKMDGKRREG